MKKETLAALTAFLLFSGQASAVDTRISLRTAEGFPPLSIMEGMIVRKGPDGTADLVLKDMQPDPGEVTDLYMAFDTEPVRDSADNYDVRGEGIVVSPVFKMRGLGSAAFRKDSRLVVEPLHRSYFSPGTVWGDFSLEFWLYPAVLEEGERIFVWRSSLPPGTEGDVQEISCRISGRSLVWEFVNFFHSPDTPEKTLILRGRRKLVPRSWHHHVVRFDSSTGMTEYLLDGIPEDIVYASRSGGEDGTILLPRIGPGAGAPLAIGEGFTGFIDEFRLSREFSEEPSLALYAQQGGFAETLPIDLGYGGSTLRRIDVRSVVPSNGAVFYFYKIGENTADFEELDWKPFAPGKDFPSGEKGRFVRLRVEMYPDGTGSSSPRISDITVVYLKNRPPPPPAHVTAVPGDGFIHLRWSTVPDPNVVGYLVYYGHAPGVYNGNDSALGPSPLRLGKAADLRLDGLKNGKLYYFVVSAYDNTQDHLSGLFSEEVSARPSRLYSNGNNEKK